jgi:NADH:ubiquinone oxidoreductase subunit 5 (subunit L)/multisubunit Na+/H+ antiporter MnhA subunit
MIEIVQNLWLIPTLPLLAAALSALLKQRRRTLAASLTIGSMALAFFLSCAAFVTTLGGHGEAVREVHNFDWFVLGETTLRLGWVLDPLTAAMLVMVTFVGLLIFIYSVGYMAHDENFTRFFCFLSLFAAAMLGVVMANSLLLLFVCWELVGLASYLLIGFWYYKPSAAAAAKKAFITTRIGDLGLFLGILWLYAESGTLLFYDAGQGCLESSVLTAMVTRTTILGMGVSTAIGLLIFCGAIGKSGQVPLHVWLPDAMEGPTPVSALIHAATMVAAGVFLVARVYPLLEAGAPKPVAELTRPAAPSALAVPGRSLTPALSLSEREKEKLPQIPGETNRVEVLASQHRSEARTMVLPLSAGESRTQGEPSSTHSSITISTALKAVTWVGAITALFAALIAVAQTDIKRILAYSTVSQLGFMFMGLGAGGVAVGMFHLLTHAFFKALLFLGAGSVIHGSHEEQDIRRMGGLRKFMPLTFATYAVGMMALSGVPLFFSGFWSKDEILHAAWLWQPSRWPFVLGILSAFLTAFYMTRQMWFVFFGTSRGVDSSSADDMQGGDLTPLSRAGALSPAAGERVQTDEGADKPAHFKAPHESPPVMIIPLAVLAVCSILLSLFGTPVWPWFHSYLSGQGAHPEVSGVVRVDMLLVMLFSAVIALSGISLSWWFYSSRPVRKAEDPDPLEKLQPGVFAVLRGKFFIDELYELSIVRFNAWSARAARWLDDKVWESGVTAVSYVVLALSWLNRLIDEFVVNFGFDQGCGGLRLGAQLLSLWQNGQVQRYLRVIALALAAFALIFIWGFGS